MTSHQLSPHARRILQRLNAGHATLSHEHEDDSWRIGIDEQPRKACEEILWLCAVRTLMDRGYRQDYVISEEGQRLLAIPNYDPIITRRKR